MPGSEVWGEVGSEACVAEHEEQAAQGGRSTKLACSAGFRTTQLPAAKAGATCAAQEANALHFLRSVTNWPASEQASGWVMPRLLPPMHPKSRPNLALPRPGMQPSPKTMKATSYLPRQHQQGEAAQQSGGEGGRGSVSTGGVQAVGACHPLTGAAGAALLP